MPPSESFASVFHHLTGQSPFPWQEALFNAFVENRAPPGLDLPGGAGKTAIMAVWLAARAAGARVPRRLVWVVGNNNAAIERASPMAEALREAVSQSPSLLKRLGLVASEGLPVASLRGRRSDSPDWLYQPHLPAILVGTVDVVGSALLFSGYGIPRAERPLAAAAIGCDSLVVLDSQEHSTAFERLLRQIAGGGGAFGPAETGMRPPIMTVMTLSSSGRLQPDGRIMGLSSQDMSDPGLAPLLTARKPLRLHDCDRRSAGFARELAERAWDLGSAGPPARILVCCDNAQEAIMTKTALDKRLGRKLRDTHSALLLGGHRARERRLLARWLERYGFTAEAEGPLDHSVYLVSNQAAEVATGIDADGLACDMVSWPRMTRRFGRVGRRAPDSVAGIAVLDRFAGETGAPPAITALRSLLEALPEKEKDGARDASAESIGTLHDNPALRRLFRRAGPDTPLCPPLSRAAVDAWAMTSLFEHQGRPGPGYWLHGWTPAVPHTGIVWRHYLPVVTRDTSRGPQYALPDYPTSLFFEAARPMRAETLRVETADAVSWLLARGNALASRRQEAPEGLHPRLPPLADRLSPVAILLSPGLRRRGLLRLSDIAIPKSAAGRLERRLRGCVLVVDARIGGLSPTGLLDPGNAELVPTAEDGWQVNGREDGDAPLISPFRVTVTSGRDREARVEGGALWQEVEAVVWRVDEEDVPVSWLSVEARDSAVLHMLDRTRAPRTESLEDHRDEIVIQAEAIAEGVNLSPADKAMLMNAALHHDDGKAARRWQRAHGAPEDWRDTPYAKTRSRVRRSMLSGYRHEFMSAVMAERQGLSLEPGDPRFALALHLIASHHGQARPSISIRGVDELPPSEAEREAFRMAQRFIRQQRLWGPWGLAWWESLLRGANYRASRKQHIEAATGNAAQ